MELPRAGRADRIEGDLELSTRRPSVRGVSTGRPGLGLSRLGLGCMSGGRIPDGRDLCAPQFQGGPGVLHLGGNCLEFEEQSDRNTPYGGSRLSSKSARKAGLGALVEPLDQFRPPVGTAHVVAL